MNRPAFPIDALLPQIRASLAAHPRLVLEAPPGAGKTTQVPPALLDEAWLAGGKILMLEPRRVAARAAAHFMAAQRGQPVGDSVGYRIRFDNQVSARTRIEVVTEGILTRMIQDDPTLEGIGAVVFDEFHERHLAADLGLALALDVQAALRPDLRIMLMSATLDGERLAQFLDAPRLSSAGRSFPVTIAHYPARREEKLEQQARRAVEHALAQHPGDVLVFLPGQREIARLQAALASLSAAATGPAHDNGTPAVEVLTLHGELPVEQQSRVLQPDPAGGRRVVLATNVAESSVTLPGVRVVIDAGLSREPRYDPNSGFSRLDLVAIAQASADQRVGRAGRVADGWAYRLWPPSQRLEPQRRPEIAQVELASLVLELAAWGDANLRFVDTPPPGAMAAARALLQRLGALDDSVLDHGQGDEGTADNDALDDGGRDDRASGHDRSAVDPSITPLGRRMLALGTHPRLAAMLLAAQGAHDRALSCDLAALIEARDPLSAAMGSPRSDALADRWQALAAFRQHRAVAQASRSALAAIDQAARQWRRRLRVEGPAPVDAPAHALGDLLLHAFPDRIARQHPGDPRRYQLANGRSAVLLDDSVLRGEPWLVIVELRAAGRAGGPGRGHGGRGDAQVLRAAPLDEARLQREFPQRFVTRDRIAWDAGARAITAVRERRFDRIVLEARALARPGDPAGVASYADALADGVRDLGLAALPWSEGLSQWRARARCVRAWLPELATLPALSDAWLLATLDTWLTPALVGKTRLAALDAQRLGEALMSTVDWSLRQRIDALAPTRITVPSGMVRDIHYAFDEDSDQPVAPVLAVKLQELFGLADTPRIADGRVPLTLHLLSPGGRPLQVTQDLQGFWQRTYPEVRREMKGRYPKHPWPDDPWTATATHRAKPKRS